MWKRPASHTLTHTHCPPSAREEKKTILINVYRWTTLKGDIAKKYLFLLLCSLMVISHIYIYCTVYIEWIYLKGWEKKIYLFWLMISKSERLWKVSENTWCPSLFYSAVHVSLFCFVFVFWRMKWSGMCGIWRDTLGAHRTGAWTVQLSTTKCKGLF